jgi:chromosome segregation ATPase
VLEAPGDSHPENAHFFLAACSQSPIEADEVFAWLPSSGNVLREREIHIGKLEGELVSKDEWLDELKASHALLQKSHEETVAELKERALWAQQLNARIDERNVAIKQLQAEAETRMAWIRNLQGQLTEASGEIGRLTAREEELQADLQARTSWARALETQLTERTEHLRVLMAENDVQKHRVEELNALRLRHADEIGQLRARQAMIAQSRWVRLGRSLNVGPEIPASGADSE